jgi:hypothetical protein
MHATVGRAARALPTSFADSMRYSRIGQANIP